MKTSAKVIDFIERFCRQKNGSKLVLLPWQIDIITKIYDTLREDGLRQYRQAFIFRCSS